MQFWQKVLVLHCRTCVDSSPGISNKVVSRFNVWHILAVRGDCWLAPVTIAFAASMSRVFLMPYEGPGTHSSSLARSHPATCDCDTLCSNKQDFPAPLDLAIGICSPNRRQIARTTVVAIPVASEVRIFP